MVCDPWEGEEEEGTGFAIGVQRVEFALGLESVEFQPGSLCRAQKSGFFVIAGAGDVSVDQGADSVGKS